MKIKLLFLAFLFPLALFGANTNKFNNIWIIDSFDSIATNNIVHSFYAGNNLNFRILNSASSPGSKTSLSLGEMINVDFLRLMYDNNAGINTLSFITNLEVYTSIGHVENVPERKFTFSNEGKFLIGTNATPSVINGIKLHVNGDAQVQTNLIVVGSAAIGTNSVRNLTSLYIEKPSGGYTNLVVRSFAGGVEQMINVLTPSNSKVFGVDNVGIITFTGAANTLDSASLNFIAPGNNVTIRNNSATAGSTITIRGGSGSGGDVIFITSNVERGMFSSSGLEIGTNSATRTPIFSSVSFLETGFDPPSIAATGQFITNIVRVGAITNAAVSIRMPAAPTAGIIYDGYVPSNGFVTIRMHNYTALPIDPASQNVGATLFNHTTQ